MNIFNLNFERLTPCDSIIHSIYDSISVARSYYLLSLVRCYHMEYYGPLTGNSIHGVRLCCNWGDMQNNHPHLQYSCMGTLLVYSRKELLIEIGTVLANPQETGKYLTGIKWSGARHAPSGALTLINYRGRTYCVCCYCIDIVSMVIVACHRYHFLPMPAWFLVLHFNGMFYTYINTSEYKLATRQVDNA